MSERKHSPLPWGFKGSLHLTDGENDSAITQDSGVIAECFGRISEDRTEDALANAAFIVTACNAHYILVRALKDIAGEDKGLDEYQLILRAREALKKAGVS